MTKRAGRSADNDDVLAAVLDARTPAVCLVGKTHDFHVTEALGITLDENLDNIRKSIEHVVAKGREAIFDAEHFFDGYKANPTYALSACSRPPIGAGARWIVLCDTNGGTLPAEVSEITRPRSSPPASPATGSASTATTTPATRWRTRWPPWTRACGRSRAR
jgi:2-isopropylmalate synthase